MDATPFELPRLSDYELVARLLLAGVLGALVGFEREWREQNAGLRTHMLVCIGSTVFTLVSAYGFSEFFTQERNSIVQDPGRIAAQIVSGIGFLGAGAILRSGFAVKGLTTAASLWAMAGIGMAVGAGMYVLAIACTIIIIFVLLVLRKLSSKLHSLSRKPEVATIDLVISRESAYTRLFETFESAKVRVLQLSSQEAGEEEQARRLSAEVMLPSGSSPSSLLPQLLSISGISSVELGDMRGTSAN